MSDLTEFKTKCQKFMIVLGKNVKAGLHISSGILLMFTGKPYFKNIFTTN